MILFLGIHLGSRRYEVGFEPFAERVALGPRNRGRPTSWPGPSATPRVSSRRAGRTRTTGSTSMISGAVEDEARRPAGSAGRLVAGGAAACGAARPPGWRPATIERLDGGPVRGSGRSVATFSEEKRLAEPDRAARQPAARCLCRPGPSREADRASRSRRRSSSTATGSPTPSQPRTCDRTISLDNAPELRGLVEAVRGTLAGDLAGLRALLHASASPAAAAAGG